MQQYVIIGFRWYTVYQKKKKYTYLRWHWDCTILQQNYFTELQYRQNFRRASWLYNLSQWHAHGQKWRPIITSGDEMIEQCHSSASSSIGFLSYYSLPKPFHCAALYIKHVLRLQWKNCMDWTGALFVIITLIMT